MKKHLDKMNNIETIEAAIEAKMAEIEKYKGIKRPNSYFMFAQFLERYAELCIDWARGCGHSHVSSKRNDKNV